MNAYHIFNTTVDITYRTYRQIIHLIYKLACFETHGHNVQLASGANIFLQRL